MIDLNTLEPYTFKDFRNYYKNYSNINELRDLYNQYLIDYNKNKFINTDTNNNYTSNYYKEFIKNIDLDNLNEDIKSFLNNLDYNDPYELDIAVHYISENINNEISRLKKYREDLKFTKIKNKFKTSSKGIQLYLLNYIIQLLSNDTFVKNNTNTINVNLKEIANKLSIKLVQYCTKSSLSTDSDEIIDKQLFESLENKVKSESKKTIQLLNVRSNNKKLKLNTSNNKKISINKLYTNYDRLPDRFFGNEFKSIENLTVNLKGSLIQKYLNTDIYYLSGDGVTYDIKKIFSAENSNSYYNRYNPQVANSYGELVKKDKIPFQLSFTNSGLAQSLSKNLTFNIDVSATKGEFILPDPNRVQSGIGLKSINTKIPTPIIFKNDNYWIKNNDLDSIVIYDNNTLKSSGYQSKENSLKYSHTGINRAQDEINFWSGEEQNIWKNSDVYTRQSLNVFPESERLEDLLINNNTATVIKNDMYGNEFIMYKPVYSKRYASTSYIQLSPSTTIPTITSCDIYDGLYFNSILSAISASKPTEFTSLTSMYDTVLTNDVSTCQGTNGFFAPLSTVDCSAISGDDLVNGGSFSNNPCIGLSENYFNRLYSNEFNTVSVPNAFTTTYELTSLNNPTLSSISLYDQKYTTTGTIYIRDVSSQKINTLYNKLSGLFTKLSSDDINAISSNQIINFDVIGNTLFIQTSSYTFTESYEYNGGEFILSTPSNSLL